MARSCVVSEIKSASSVEEGTEGTEPDDEVTTVLLVAMFEGVVVVIDRSTGGDFDEGEKKIYIST